MRLFKFRRDPTDPVERVDRFWHGRRLRLVAGLSVANDFSGVRGVIVRAQGEGKFLRFEPITAQTAPLRPELAQACRTLALAGVGTTVEFEALKNDLAVVQADLLNRLRTACGSIAEFLLAVAVADPGLWGRDFDGKPLYASFCNPESLSALSGVSVIDALPAKDLVAGGHGWPLTPLACWLLAADRASPMATHARLLIHVDRDVEMFYLPLSDGLDDEYPPIRYGRIPFPVADAQPSYTGGLADELIAAWSAACDQADRRTHPAVVHAVLVQRTSEVANDAGLDAADIDTTAIHWMRTRFASNLVDFVASSDTPLQVFLIGDERLGSILRPEIERIVPSAPINFPGALGGAESCLAAVLVAALGAMHVDQMPANMPWLTGAETPRILGRLTPGSPKQWRMLLREMADYHPAAMRLRDAV